MIKINELLQGRWIAIWYRNLLVWSRSLFPSLLANFGEPLLYIVGLGYGLGLLVGKVNDISYMTFLASGIVCASGMNGATFEALYSAYTRMDIQHTWQGMLATPMDVQDIVIGEMVWASTKSLFSVIVILLVIMLLGMTSSGLVIWVLPVMMLVSLCFAAMALVVTALAHSYDFFLYYVTLVITPLTLVSGVFFPLDTLPLSVQLVANLFPLIHAVELTRPFVIGQWPTNIIFHLLVIVLYSVISIKIAITLLQRRLHN